MTRYRRVLDGSAIAFVLIVLAFRVAVGQSAEPVDPEARPDQTTLKASAGKSGVRVTVKVDGPLVAGEPAVVRTRVKNTLRTDVWWQPGAYGPSISATMTEATRRLGQPLSRIRPGRIDLKNSLFGGRDRLVFLPFEPHRTDGADPSGPGPVRIKNPIGPGEEVVFVHRWDGQLHLEDGPGGIGLPPDGPVRIDSVIRYSPFAASGPYRRIETKVQTEVVDGWSDDRLHPTEVVDAAMADRDFVEVMGKRDFGRYSQGMLWWDDDEQLWFTGTCTYVADDKPARWHLATVDPFTAAVQLVPEVPETKHCGRVPSW